MQMGLVVAVCKLSESTTFVFPRKLKKKIQLQGKIEYFAQKKDGRSHESWDKKFICFYISVAIYFWINDFKCDYTCTEGESRSVGPGDVITKDVIEKFCGILMKDHRVKMSVIA